MKRLLLLVAFFLPVVVWAQVPDTLTLGYAFNPKVVPDDPLWVEYDIINLKQCLRDTIVIKITSSHPLHSPYTVGMLAAVTEGFIAAGVPEDLPFTLAHYEVSQKTTTMVEVVFIGENLFECVVPWKKE